MCAVGNALAGAKVGIEIELLAHESGERRKTRHACFFFFQAEDGIRDYKVTGVQTCALPISEPHLVTDGLALHNKTRLLASVDKLHGIVEKVGDALGQQGLMASDGKERALDQIGRASCRERV